MDRHIISENAQLIDAIAKLNQLSGKVMTLFVIDHNHRVTGSLTDGDVRRALLSGVSVTDPVSRAANIAGGEECRVPGDT